MVIVDKIDVRRSFPGPFDMRQQMMIVPQPDIFAADLTIILGLDQELPGLVIKHVQATIFDALPANAYLSAGGVWLKRSRTAICERARPSPVTVTSSVTIHVH